MTRTLHRIIPAVTAAILLTGPAARHHGAAAFAQAPSPRIVDVPDSLPHWKWDQAVQLAVREARRLAWKALGDRIADSLAVLITGDERSTGWNSHVDRNQGQEECRVLAWRLLMRVYAFPGCLMREALISVRLVDALGRRRLALVLVDAPHANCSMRPSQGDYYWQYAYPDFNVLPGNRKAGDTIPEKERRRLKQPYEYTMTLLPDRPGNEAVYEFLRTFDAFRARDNKERTMPYPGVFADLPLVPTAGSWALLDGGIRREAWEDAVGEAPTKFFSNGR